MILKTKELPSLLLGVSSIVCSRTFFLFVDDPEGPNLFVVAVLALALYVPTLLLYWLASFGSGWGRFALALGLQVAIVVFLVLGFA